MKTMLEGLVWHPSWMSLMGCFKGCLDYLGRELSRAWIAGGTGHAFAINIHEQLCPSGPTAWNTGRVHELGGKVGWAEQTVHRDKRADEFADRQREAFQMVRAALAEGTPCFGWELPVPEYYVICGCDDEGYYTSGPMRGPGDPAIPWQSVGDTGIGALQISAIRLAEPAPDEVVVREALSFALEMNDAPDRYSWDKWTMGTGAFDLWAEALEEGKADRFGLGYNTACWAECRSDAVKFLQEARHRLAGEAPGLFDEAADFYSSVHEKLEALGEIYPFTHEEGGQNVRDAEAARLVRQAKEAEEDALDVVRELVATL